MPLHPDFRDLLAVFAAHHVDYLVVGGYAVGFYARPRFTKDIDLWVGNAPENLKRARGALKEFGAPVAMLEQLESALDEDVLWMGVPPVRNTATPTLLPLMPRAHQMRPAPRIRSHPSAVWPSVHLANHRAHPLVTHHVSLA